MASARPQKKRQGPQIKEQKQRQRVLRVGVILGGKIVEERLLRERKDVTIGQSAKNTFSVPVEGLPRTWPLFKVQNDRYFLNYADNMDGRLSQGGEVHTLSALKDRNAQRRDNGWVVSLPDNSRGKIVVGDMSLLFQFVTEPPRQPRPHLPASVRGTFTDRIDPMLAVILAISLLFHFSIAFYARLWHDPQVRTRTARIFNETFQRPTVAAVELELNRETTPGKADKKTDKKPDKEAKKSASKPKKPKAGTGGDDKPGERSAEERLRLEEEARRAAETLLAGITSEGGVSGGASDRDPRNDLGEAIDGINKSGATVDLGKGSDRRTRGDGSSQIGTSKGPKVEGPGSSTTRAEQKTREKVPRSRVKIGGGSSEDDTTLSPDAVMRRINSAYMSGLKRCHKELLKRDPSASGKVQLKFKVGPSGRVVSAKVRQGFDPGVSACIEGKARRWRFGIPKDEDGEPTDAWFDVALVLTAT